MEAYRPKATHSLSRDSLFANAPPSPVATTRVKTIDISGASTLRVPSGRAGNKGAVRENSVSLAPSEGEEKTRLTSPESSSVSLSFGPKVTPPPGSRTTAPPPSRVETFGADVIHTSAGPHVAVSAAASLSREPAGAVLSAGAIFHRRAPSTDSDGSSASAWRLRAFSAKPVTESDLPAGVNVYVAQPYVPDESEDDAPEFWAKPVDPPLGSQADLPPGAPVSAAQPNTPGEDKDGASEAWVKPVNSATPPEPWSERPPSTEPHNLQPFNSDLEMQKAREFGLAKSATPVAQQPNSPPPKTIYVAQSFVPVDIEDKTAEVSAKPAVPNPGFQANPNLGFEANPDLGVESSSDPWSELGAEKVWEENTFRDPGDGVAKRKAESSTPPTEAPSAAVRRITPSERNPKLEAPTPPPMFDEPHALAGTDLPSGAERVEPVVPQTLRQVNIGRTSGGEESGVPTTPPKASTPPSVSPTFQRAMLEYQKMKALFGPRSKSDPPKGGPENAASDRGVPDAEEGVGSDQEVFEEIDLDEGGGSKAETEGGGFKSGLKKWASGVEGMFRGVSVAKLSDASGASQSSENLHGRGVEEERAVGPDRLANAEQRSVAKAEKDQTTVDERALAVGTEGKEKGRKIVVPKGVEITVGKVTASGVASEPVRRAVSEPVVAAKGGPGSSTSRGVGKETSSGDVREWGESLKGLGTSANSGNNLVATGGSGSGSFRGGAEVGRSRNYGSTSSLGAWSDDSESELVRTVERLQLEEGGYVIRAVMKRVPKSGRSSPLLAGSRGTSPEPTFDGLQDDVALAGGVLRDDVAPEGEGLRGDVAPAGEGLRSDGATAEGGSRSDVALAQEGSRRDGRAPAMGDLQNDVALAGKDAQSDVTLSGQGLRASSGEVGRPEGAGEDAKSLQIPDALKKDLESEDGPETSGKLPGRDGVSGKGVLDQKRSEMDATTEGKVGASAKAAFKSAVLETSSGVGKRYEPAEEFPEGKEGSLERGKGERESADKAGGALQETPKAEPLLQATVSRIGSVGGTTVPGGSQPASETGSQDKAGPPETGAERATGATLLEAVAGGEARMTSPEAMLASPRRSGKFTGLSRVEVPAPAERSGPFPEAPKVTSARTKNVRLETRISAPGAMEARTTASSGMIFLRSI